MGNRLCRCHHPAFGGTLPRSDAFDAQEISRLRVMDQGGNDVCLDFGSDVSLSGSLAPTSEGHILLVVGDLRPLAGCAGCSQHPHNIFRVPDWLKPAIQSEFYIKIGIVCLGSTILFGEVLKSGVFGLAQALIVVFCVWFFAYRISRKMGVDDEMSTMLASSVSICGVSAAIATAGVIKGDNKKLSYVISLVLVCAIPMMYLMPWIANLIGLSEEVAGAWLGGTIDTTGAVAASGTMLGEAAAQTAIIVKSSQNVLLGIAAFIISLMWTYKGEVHEEKPTLGVIWDRFPKFVVGFILASLVFSFLLDVDCAKSVGKITKGFTNTLFSIAFVCVGLETRFADIFSKENRRPMWAFLTAQGFNIVVTLIVAWVLFGIIKPLLA